MTAKQVIQKLQELPDDTPIFFRENSTKTTFPAIAITNPPVNWAFKHNDPDHRNIILESYELSEYSNLWLIEAEEE
jgi:hypothetical protein